MIRQSLSNKKILEVKGCQIKNILNGIITNDINLLEKNHTKLIHSAILNPHGRWLFDFFILKNNILSENKNEESYLIIIEEQLVTEIKKKFDRYKIIHDIEVNEIKQEIFVNWSNEKISAKPAKDDFIDPRSMTKDVWQSFSFSKNDKYISSPINEWQEFRIKNLFVEGYFDMISGESILLENHMENSISFEKGCFIGQEFTRSTKFRLQIKKQLFAIRIINNYNENIYPKGESIFNNNNKLVGKLMYQQGNLATALLKKEDCTSELLIKDSKTEIISS